MLLFCLILFAASGCGSSPSVQALFTFTVTDLTVEFHNWSVADPSGELAYSWDFGDGSALSTEQNPTHLYSAAGTYSVALTVTDDNGDFSISEQQVVIEVTEPSTITSSFIYVKTNLSVAFTDTSTSVDSTIASYSWDFGDGVGTSTEANPKYTYSLAGEYDVELTVTSSTDKVKTYNRKIKVGITSKVSNDYATSLSVSADRSVLSTWGKNSDGQLGNGENSSRYYTPQHVEGLSAETVTKTVGYQNDYMFALTASGKLYSWGALNQDGQLGIDSALASRPQQVLIPTGETVTSIATRDNGIHALTTSGKVYAWGKNNGNQLGLGDEVNRLVPQIVVFPDNEQIVSLSEGYGGYAVSISGKVYAWGSNNLGQLGTGNTTNMDKPTLVTGLPAGDKVVSVTAAEYSAFAITESGKAYAWGRNNKGQLGVGSTDQVNTPKQINIGENTKNIYVGSGSDSAGEAAFAVTDNGTVYSWGSRYLGVANVTD